MYANDIPAKVKNGGGTKRWLLDVAQRNAVSVIELEKSYI
jgi:hypothetical protein